MSAPPDVFSPAKLGPLTLRNRIIKAATFEARTPNALVSDDLIEYHRRPAAGGVGMTTVAYCAVSQGGRTEGNGLWMRPEAVPGLRRLTDAIHRLLVAEEEQGRLHLSADLGEVAFAIVRIIESYTYLDLILGEKPEAKRAEPILRLMLC